MARKSVCKYYYINARSFARVYYDVRINIVLAAFELCITKGTCIHFCLRNVVNFSITRIEPTPFGKRRSRERKCSLNFIRLLRKCFFSTVWNKYLSIISKCI